ncbi:MULTISPECIES: FIMAH domain-containing protein [Siminovitchia]
MEKTVQQFEKDGEFTNNEAARSLQVHLVSIHHFEQQGKAEKVVQHMKSFYPLLDHYFQKGHMSERAYQTLKSDTDYFIKKWQ